ncbi:MAG: hypothetical protein KF774_01100 [Planctomyces sp.]|nr:hypothetical protein [Planctomyces sp.]
MRVLYGCNTQGQGHLGKAAVLVPALLARGHEVRVVSSGPRPPEHYRFPGHLHVAGLEYAIEAGRADIARTARDWLRSSPQLLASLRQVRRLVADFQPELILSDFEPFTASPLISPPCEVVSVCRQAALLDPAISTPPPTTRAAHLARTVIRLFLLGADRRLGYHYAPESRRCLPPIIRPELFLLRPEPGNHVLIYNHHYVLEGEAERLIRWASDRRMEVRAYGFTSVPRGRIGYVRFQPSSRSQMLLDMATARAIATTSGLTTPAEGFLLHKPVCVVPLPGQWEQQANAAHLENLGMAVASSAWDYNRLLEIPAPRPEHPLHRWLTTGSEQVLDAILAGSAPARRAA